ncbi:restriction endonuclease [Muricauda oceani]|uniref:Restriction endonuclease n=1 Tax=Flagellimonas oceani TaxID=2698672 RepID=A0A6G7J372_9FLAO|nr:restriction endonuclease [Allomuricauda oceani]MBW8244017.1 restriction endonuclease [Allomuricauda oceani]QII44994.1 restriction endonuclease [Allomuricauda oceani]
MARKGRKFEVLVESLEKHALNKEGVISSPGYLMDEVTNQMREVDVLIETKIGTSNISIVLECRDRKMKQDLTWIEQLNSKLKDINADKIIAVSSSGFSKSALEKAKRYGIETRSFDEIDKNIIESWWQVTHIDFISKQFRIVYFYPYLEDKDFFKKYRIPINSEEKYILDTSENRLVSASELFQENCNQIQSLWGSLIPNGKASRDRINIDCDNPERELQFVFNEHKSKILKIEYVADIFIVGKKIPLSKVSSYTSPDSTISHIIEYDGFPIKNKNLLRIIRSKDGNSIISFGQE